MRRLMPSFAIVFLAAFVVAPGVGAQDEAEAEEDALAFYLHNVGSACEDGAFELFMDTEDTEGDQDGCGTIGGGFVDASFVNDYPSKEPLGLEILEGSTATVHVFVTTANPSEVTVSASYGVGKKRCAGTSAPQELTNAYGVVADYAEFTFDCTFEGKPDANGTSTKKPSFSLTVVSDASVFYGYEGDHASRIDLFGLGQAMAPIDTEAAGEPEAESPAPGALVVLAAVAAASVVVLRRRT